MHCTNLQWPRSQKGCPSCNWIFFNFHVCKVEFFQSCTFENMQFVKLNLRAGENCDVYAMRFPTHVHTYTSWL